jgi:ATPase family protein associated with various cellular activities (AAA)/winged helix domain-containing protein
MNSGEALWDELNQRYLMASLAEVRACLEHRIGPQGADPERHVALQKPTPAELEPLPVPTALQRLVESFGLSEFETSVLLLCAGVELDASFAALVAQVQRSAQQQPTFSLAMEVLPKAHWSAVSPAGTLRRWRFVDVLPQPGIPTVNSPLRIDERILHFLAGIQYLDDRIEGAIEPVASQELVSSHEQLAHQIAESLQAALQETRRLPVIQLCGPDEATKVAVAAAASERMGLRLFATWAENLPGNGTEMEALVRLWEREAVLTSSSLLVVTDTSDRNDHRAILQVSRLLEHVMGPVFLSSRDRWRPLRRSLLTLDVGKPSSVEQADAWSRLLNVAGVDVNGLVKQLASQFNLSLSDIQQTVQRATSGETHGQALSSRLWAASRSQARPRLEDLAHRIEPRACWRDLVLPEAQKDLLRQIACHVAHRGVVYRDWGFADNCSSGLGISALFAGGTGTGKTMAAEVLANELELDLYRIDLSCVVSKYIGETEKNLRRVFDAAEDGGAILFFDEADALFGKRSEVKDSHDRYANIEINYLLQRMESYSGLSVLATNLKSALDPAFLRRLRFLINFPFPDTASRAAIWENIFPKATPTDRLDVGVLARLDIAGGNIRNIALNAAFLAAEAREPVRMAHIWSAARAEYAKMERPLTEIEIRGWQ